MGPDEPLGIAAQARRTPDKTALVSGSVRLSYAQLDSFANRAAHVLQGEGLVAGTRLAIALRNRPEFYVLTHGAARIGVDIVPISWRCKADEVRYMMEDSGAKLIVCEDDATDTVVGFTTIRFGELSAAFEAQPSSPPGGVVDPVQVWSRVYTSGTTGNPKSVDRVKPDIGTAMASSRAMAEFWGFASNTDVHIACGPLYHSAPFAFSHQAFFLGQTVVQTSDHFDAEECLALIEKERATWSHMVPIHFIRILALPDDVGMRYDLSSVTRILHSAAPCPPDVKRRIMDVFPPGVVYEIYGATEGMGTFISPEEWKEKPGSVGKAASGLTLKILDDDGNELPAGEVGLIYMSSPPGSRFSYENAREKTRAAFRGDLFTVNDMGYLDDDGFLFLTDRKTDMIISGGSNVYPYEVEVVLYTHPAVKDAVVFGVPDDEWGESVKAIIELVSRATDTDLIEYCRERLAHYKCPKTVDFVDAMPRELNGKIRKRALREPYWADQAKRI